MNYVIFLKLCDQMRFKVNCAKSHHRIISDGLDACIMLGFCPVQQSVFLFKREWFFVLIVCHLNVLNVFLKAKVSESFMATE